MMAVEIIGNSSALQKVLTEASNLANTDYSVIIRGETGTGKELIARYIHENSPRGTKKFLAVNISSFNENLIDSELFGHVKGAFTGAFTAHKGVLEEVEDGTIFLDEIGDLSLGSQVKLLRVLESKEFRQVGGSSTLKMQARVLAATNADLEKMVEQKRFRQDLYYRFGPNVSIPPLRERKTDIVHLAEHILQGEISANGRRTPAWFDAEYQQKLGCLLAAFPYHWPGNVRSLQLAVRLVLLECVYSGASDKFEENVQWVLANKCRNDEISSENQLCTLLSNLVREHIAGFPVSQSSLRSRINELLQNGISEGIDLAISVDGFIPRTRKEMGEVLGINTLINSNHPNLPKNDNDYMVKALKSVKFKDELPEKICQMISV